jgi:hypothetical protein
VLLNSAGLAGRVAAALAGRRAAGEAKEQTSS